MSDYMDWPGKSGKIYRYWYLTSDAIKAEGGNYVFVKRLADGACLPLYFGETGDLSQRLPGHDVWAAAVRLGATHVQAHTTLGGAQARLDEEEDLIARWNPALNVQHRTAQ